MIPANEIVAAFQSYLSNHDGYIPATSGEVWTLSKQEKKAVIDTQVAKYGAQWIGHHVEDCSGAFVRFYREHSLSIYHGSNRIAREYVIELLPPSYAKPGMAAFKAYKPGDKYYALPSEYKPGGAHYNGDLLDYYHIGLVDDDPAYVINSASTKSGVKRGKLSDNWCAVGYLKAIDYTNGGDEPVKEYLYKAIVDSANDKPVNLRKSPSLMASRIAEVPDGTEVEVISEYDSAWSKITAGAKTGYMMRKYLVKLDTDSGENTEQPTDESQYVNALKQIIEIAQAALQAAEKG